MVGYLEPDKTAGREMMDDRIRYVQHGAVDAFKRGFGAAFLQLTKPTVKGLGMST